MQGQPGGAVACLGKHHAHVYFHKMHPKKEKTLSEE